MPQGVDKRNHDPATVPNSLLIMSCTSVNARHATDRSKTAVVEKEEEYGMKRLSEIIPGFAGNESKEIANLIIDDVTRFVGSAEQYDDMTLTVMKIK